MACLTEKEESSRWQVRYTERISPKEPSCTPLGHGTSEYLRLNEENEKENRGEATRRGIVDKNFFFKKEKGKLLPYTTALNSERTKK